MNTIVTKTEIKLDSKPARTKNAKPVYCISDGKVYASCLDAAKATGNCTSAISSVCRGVFKTAKGKQYCFVKDMSIHVVDVSNAMQAAARDANIYRAKEAYEKKKEKLTKDIENYKRRIETYQQSLDELEIMYAEVQNK